VYYPVGSAMSGPRSGLCSLPFAVYVAYIGGRPKLLRVKPLEKTSPPARDPTPTDDSDDDDAPHRDEYQIRLDTERSFVFYPVGEPPLSLPISPPPLPSPFLLADHIFVRREHETTTRPTSAIT
jgi:hypothetical protein